MPKTFLQLRFPKARRIGLDWDESHVDVPDLDLVLPHNAAGLDGGAHDIAAQASAAWEAAVCWDDEYAIKQLAEVRAVGAAAATVLNMKTAKALGLTIPPGILAIADEVIE